MDRAAKVRSTIRVFIGGNLAFLGYATIMGDEKFYRQVIMPTCRLFNAERAQTLAIKMARYGVMPIMKKIEHPSLKTNVWGKSFSNPVGLAAGFDKNAEAVEGLFKMGFGFVEVGTVTPLPQEGNPKPRVFRLAEDKAIINRCGFNSDGHEVVYERLRSRQPKRAGQGIVGVNLGKNKTSSDAVGDYIAGVKKFGELSDYLVINISSPNTPGLRELQKKEQLEQLIDKVVEESNQFPLKSKPPILIKIAPDLTPEEKADIAAVVLRPQGGIDGIIISNTTVTRPSSLQSRHKSELGGLSGEPLRQLSTDTVRDMYSLTKGKVPIVGVGGVSSGKDAFDKIKAGASLVQVYSALAYLGPPTVNKINEELQILLEKEGYSTVSEAVGADSKMASNQEISS